MSILITILLILGGIIALLLLVAAFMSKAHYVKREVIINAPRQKVYDFVKLLKNQERFNKWAQADAERSWIFKGTDGTVGFIISWNGDKSVGEGEKEIMKLVGGERVETQIRFVRPFVNTADIVMEMKSLSPDQTNVSWSNAGTLMYPLNIMIPVFLKNFARDMDESLVMLKNILENNQGA
ncbi:MAG: SRPBCC family protein [bacterium]